jgi:ubiquinone biosynthesis O-methyltransferase
MAGWASPSPASTPRERNIGTASTHAAEQGLSIDYRARRPRRLLAAGEPPFDVILNMEVIEHVADPGEYLRVCARMLAPGGVMIVATLNRTLKALALAKIGAEYILRWVPAGTHDWKKFLKPDESAASWRASPSRWTARSASSSTRSPAAGRNRATRRQLHDDRHQGGGTRIAVCRRCAS